MAIANTTEAIQKLYIAFFNRPAEPGGLAFWVDAVNNKGGTLAGVSAAFARDTEYQAQFANLKPDQIIAKIYDNLFNRLPDPSGLNFWSGKLQSGDLTIANIVDTIADSALNNPSVSAADTAAISSKIQAAVKFTDLLNSDVALRLAYGNPQAGEVAKAFIHGVTSEATLATAVANLPTVTAQAILDAGQPIGSSFNLTVGVDTPVGTNANDTFNALSLNPVNGDTKTTLGSFDVIDGGAGRDTLNIYSDTAANVDQVGTVRNVETINIYNPTTGVVFGGTGVDASKFEGATAVWQIGQANKVIGLGATTAAGFRSIAKEDLSVAATEAAATVALDKVSGDDVANATKLEVKGAKLNSVTVTGTLADNQTAIDADADPASLTLTAIVGKDQQTLTVNTAVNTALTIDDSGSTKKVTTLAAGASTGAIKVDGGTTVASITTGAGADNVTLGATLDATVAKTATVTTGAGKDKIFITATGADVKVNAVTVDAGADNDKIELTLDTNVKYNVTGGAGDDTIKLVSGNVKVGDVIDGGEGADTIALAGQAAYVPDDYLVYTKVLKSFEAIEFTSAAGTGTAFDASQVAGFKTFTFDAGGAITKVAADQTVNTAGNLSIKAAGYTAAAADAATSTTVYSTDAATGALKVNVTADATVTAGANSIALNVTAASDKADGGVDAILTGDVKSATVTLANGVNADDSFSVATIAVTTAKDVAGTNLGAFTKLGNLSSLTLAGNGSATVTNAVDTKLATVDASGLNSVDAEGKAAAGLKYVSTNATVETIKLGAGLDDVTLSASTFGAVGGHKWDTVAGLNLVAGGDGKLDTAASDKLAITGVTTAVKFTTTETDIDLALKAAAAADKADAAHDAVVFTLGGDTYVFSDTGDNGIIDANDIVVKLTGTVNLDLLASALTTA